MAPVSLTDSVIEGKGPRRSVRLLRTAWPLSPSRSALMAIWLRAIVLHFTPGCYCQEAIISAELWFNSQLKLINYSGDPFIS